MRILVTGSSGHLGEALVRDFGTRHDVVGVDLLSSESTAHVGSIDDAAFVRECMHGVDAVLHTATLHKPHVQTHNKHMFVATNLTGTLNLLEEAVAQKVGAFVFTSTTSAFGRALKPAPGAPAVWISEDVAGKPKNIYGVTKTAAEDLCELVHREHDLPCLVLRTSRFFPEDDDSRAVRDQYTGDNAKVNELLNRRADVADIVSAHELAISRARELPFGKYIISATTPFTRAHLAGLRDDATEVVRALFPDYLEVYAQRGWRMFPAFDRVYDNEKARRDLGWRPRFDFASALRALRDDAPFNSALARAVGSKGYHAERFADGPYPVAE